MALDAIDLSCTNDIDPNLRVISGPRGVAEAVYRELITPAGKLWWDSTRGLGLQRYINAASDATLPSQIASQVEAVALADERVYNAKATVTLQDDGFFLDLKLTLNDGSTDKFSVAVTSLGSSLLYG